MRRGACLAFLTVGWVGALAAQIDPSASHRTLHTSHFRIHFRPAHRAVAHAAAREAERAYALLARELVTPRGTIDLLLTDELDVPNGFAGVFPSNRITVFLPPPTSGGIADFDDWLRLVITHELVHIFHLDRTGGPWRVLQWVFGRAPGLFPNAYQPSWVSEGLATYYESRYTAGGRVPSSFHRQIVQAERARHRERNPNDATFVEIRWPGGNTPYVYGARFFEHLTASTSDTVASALVEATGHQWIPYRVGRQVWRVSRKRLDAAWPEAVAGAGPDPARDPTEPAQWVVASGLLAPPAARLSPDGSRLAYVHDDGITPRRIVLLDLGTRAEVASHLVNAFPELAWMGDTLLVTQLDWTGRYQLRNDLYRWQPDGGAWRRVTTRGRLTRPEAGRGRVLAIRLLPASREPVAVGDGGTLTPIPVPDTGAVWGQVAPSPVGALLAGVRHADGAWDVVVWEEGRVARPTAVTRGSPVEADLAWTGAGTLVFTSDAGGLPQAYAWRPGDGPPVRLTDAPNGAREPQLAADGTVFYSTIDATGHALVAATAQRVPARLDGALARGLTEAPPVETRETGYAFWPALRPQYWLPYVVASGEGRFFLGGLTSGSDALERNAYVGALGVDVERARWQGFVSLRDARFGRPVLDLAASQEWSSALLSDGSTIEIRERDAALGATWGWRRWRWDVRLRAAVEYEHERFEPPRFLAREYAGGSVRMAVARSITPTLAISRERGFEIGALLRRRERLGGAGWSNEARGLIAVFLPTPVRRHVVALRASLGVTGGPDAPRLAVGGVSGRAIAPVGGITLGESRSFPVRGYPASTLAGTRATSATVEYRAPLVYVGRGVGSLPVGVIRLSGAAFGDVGGAWDSGLARRPTALVSLGGELGLDLTVSYDIPVRLRLGLALPQRAAAATPVGRPVGYVTLGSDF